MSDSTQANHQLPEYPEPYWRKEIEIPSFPPLTEDLEVDVAIVGGGITGVTAAYLLVKEGVKVALLEASELLNGTTGHTTAKVTCQHGLIYDEFIQHFGPKKTKLYYKANLEALQFIKETIRDLKINCDYSEEDAYLYATSDTYSKKIEKEFKAYQKLNIEGELTTDLPLELDIHNALIMKNQAQFHPLKYLIPLVKEIQKGGGLIFEKTTAVNVKGVAKGTQVLTRNGSKVTCKSVLACSHFPFYEGTGFYFSRMYADRSYLLAAKSSHHYPGGYYLNVDPPKRSIRSVTHNGETLLLIGGENHKTGQGKDTLEHYKAIEAFGREQLGVEEILYRWSAQDLTTLDKMPYIGPLTSGQHHVFVATGFRKWGMTNGTAAALLLRDLVLKKKNQYEALFNPSRFYADPSLKHFFMDNVDVAKHLIKGKLEVPHTDINDLGKDQGAVVTLNGERKGAYRDGDGKLHIVDTTCTHMGCELNWNHGDRTWDCPCHGSRFSYTGDVIEGPAEKPLQRHGDFNMLDNLTSDESGY